MIDCIHVTLNQDLLCDGTKKLIKLQLAEIFSNKFFNVRTIFLILMMLNNKSHEIIKLTRLPVYGSHTDPLILGVRERNEYCENINHNDKMKIIILNKKIIFVLQKVW